MTKPHQRCKRTLRARSQRDKPASDCL